MLESLILISVKSFRLKIETFNNKFKFRPKLITNDSKKTIEFKPTSYQNFLSWLISYKTSKAETKNK